MNRCASGGRRRQGGDTLTGNFNDTTSIYLQIAEMLENDVLRGVLDEEEQVPSTNELARAYSINPATAAKGINLLVDAGIPVSYTHLDVYKRQTPSWARAKPTALWTRATC